LCSTKAVKAEQNKRKQRRRLHYFNNESSKNGNVNLVRRKSAEEEWEI
jgi:hypothetical protein